MQPNALEAPTEILKIPGGKSIVAMLLLMGSLGAAETLFNAADYGAVPGDGQSDIAALQKAFAACAAADGDKVLKLPAGVYDIPEGAVNAIEITDVNDLTVDAAGAVIVAGKTTPLRFRNCRNLVIKGLTIKSGVKNYSVGKLVAKTADSLTVQYPAGDQITAATVVQNLQDYQPETQMVIGNLDIFSPNFSKVEDVGEHTVRYTVKGAPAAETRKAEYVKAAMAHLTVGCDIVARHEVYSGYGLDFDNCAKLLLQNVTVNSMTGFAAKFIECSDVTLRRFVVEPAPDAASCHLSTSGDSVMFLYLQGYLLVEDSKIVRGGDDCLTVMTKYLEGEQKLDDRTISASIKYGWQGAAPAGGDTLIFRRRETLETVAQAKVKAAKWDAKARRWTIVFAEALPAAVQANDVMTNPRYLPKITIRNSVFGEGRARGLILDSEDILLENNEFRHMAMPAVKLWTEMQVSIHMGPPPQNVTIRNNRFYDCGMVPLLIYAGCTDPAPVIRRITVENNTFIEKGPLNALRMKQFMGDHPYWSSAIYLRGAGDVAIRNNRFEGYMHAIYASDCRNLAISDNVSDVPAEIALAPTATADSGNNRNMSVKTGGDPVVEGITLYSYLR